MSKQAFAAAVFVAAVMPVVPAAALAGPAATTSDSYVIKATLDTRHQVPAPKDAASARGVLTGKVTIAGKKSTFVWHLTLSGLSGRALAGGVGFGQPGKAGTTAVTLCHPCKAVVDGGYTGSYVSSSVFLKALLHDGMYAFVTTKLNPKGEVRGQIKASSA